MESIQILDSIVPGYTKRFLSGQFSLDEMPLLEALGNKFTKNMRGIDTSNTYIIACQHLLKPQLAMFELLTKLGIHPSHIFILPKIYSANQTVSEKLERLGCKISKDALSFHPSESFDVFHTKQCNQLVEYIFQTVSNNAKLVILDDGGMLIKAFAQSKNIASFKGKLYGIEQTASGKNILSKITLPFVVTNVAGSIEKISIETNYVIRHALLRSEEYLSEHNITITAKILVLGKGPIGATLISRLLERGYDCSGYDITEGILKENLGGYDVIFGATGSNSISIQQLSELKDGVHLISISSSDREFPSVHIRTHAVIGKNVHDTFVYEHKKIHLANGGFPITFKGCEIECYPLEMDVTKMKLTEAILLHITSQTGYETSINQQTDDAKIKTFASKIVWLWVIAIAVLIGIKISYFGFWNIPPQWFIFLVSGVALSVCYPVLRFINYHRQIERFT